jgi:hypothetical protein
MKTALLLVVALLAACASAPPPSQDPLVVAFDWKPSKLDERPATTLYPKHIRNREDMISLVVRNRFSIQFPNVKVVDQKAAAEHPTRVDFTIAELATAEWQGAAQTYSGPYARPVPSTRQRCGTVEYVLFVEGAESARQQYPLECDTEGFAVQDYEKATQRAVEEVARRMRSVS